MAFEDGISTKTPRHRLFIYTSARLRLKRGGHISAGGFCLLTAMWSGRLGMAACGLMGVGTSLGRTV